MPKKKSKYLQNLEEKLTPKQVKWAHEYVKTDNATEAARRTYDIGARSDITKYKNPGVTSANKIGSHNKRNPNIMKYIRGIAYEAAGRVEELSISAKNETVRLNANKDILDRAGYKPQEHIDIRTEISRIYTKEQIKKAAKEIVEGQIVT